MKAILSNCVYDKRDESVQTLASFVHSFLQIAGWSTFLLIKLVTYYSKKWNLIIIMIIHLLCKNLCIAEWKTFFRQLLVTHFIHFAHSEFPTGNMCMLLGRHWKMIMTNPVLWGPFRIYRNIIYPPNWLNLGWHYGDPKQIKMETIFLLSPSTAI